MAIQNINIGQAPNDGKGAKLREAFSTANQNFSELDQRATAAQGTADTAKEKADAAVPASQLQTDSLDGVLGKVLRLAASGAGAFGLGSVTPTDWPGNDLDAAPPTGTGFYRLTSAAVNLPPGAGVGVVLWIRYSTANGWMLYVGQTTGVVYVRRWVSSAWAAWYRADLRGAGWGAIGSESLPVVADLDDLTLGAGIVRYNSTTLGKPAAIAATTGTVLIEQQTTNYRTMTITSNAAVSRRYWRVCINNVWQPWTELLSDSNGVGYVGDISGTGVDLNTYQTRGIWRIVGSSVAAGGVNFPIAQSGWLEVISPVGQNSSAAAAGVAQRYTATNSNRIFTRQALSGSWSAWVELVRSDSVQTGQVDKTAGRLLTVGAFGLGGFTPLHSALGYANDFNVIDGETGFMAINGSFTNGPRGAAAAAYAGQLLMARRTGTSGMSTVQMYWGLRTSGDGGMWYREGAGNAGAMTWQPWLRLVDTAAMASTLSTTLANYTTWVYVNTPLNLDTTLDPNVILQVSATSWTGTGAGGFPARAAAPSVLYVHRMASDSFMQTLMCHASSSPRPIVFQRRGVGSPVVWTGWRVINPVSRLADLPTADCGDIEVDGEGKFRWSTVNSRYCRVPTFTNMAVITASGTWTPDVYTETIEVEAIGGGGAGGGGYNFGGGGGGGAGQYLTPTRYSVTPGVALTATIGAGGASTTSSGGNTALGALFPALSGGTGGTNATNDFGGVGGIPGGAHGSSGSAGVVTGGGGSGAGTRFGTGGRGGARSGAAGTPGYDGDSPPDTSYGAGGGGGGGGYNASNSSRGGAGRAGVIIVRW